MDVVLGVAVTGRVARLAMIGSPASGGQVLDQYALDLTDDDATTDLAETIVGTYRAVAESGNRVAATRLCLPDASEAETLRQTVSNAGVQNVEVVAETEAAAALGPQCRRGRRVTAGRRRHRRADGDRRGRGVDVGAGVGAHRLGRCGRRVCRCAAAGASGGHHPGHVGGAAVGPRFGCGRAEFDDAGGGAAGSGLRDRPRCRADGR